MIGIKSLKTTLISKLSNFLVVMNMISSCCLFVSFLCLLFFGYKLIVTVKDFEAIANISIHKRKVFSCFAFANGIL